MVKPTISMAKTPIKKVKSEVLRGNALIEKVKSDKDFREQTLLNTANRLALKGFSGDVSFVRVADSGKSFHLSFNGKESPSKYVVVPYKNQSGKLQAAFMSSRALGFKSRQ